MDPLAVCNDGTPAAYFVGNATTRAGRGKWLIYLGGGGQCWDEASCQARWDGSAYPHHACDGAPNATQPCFMSSRDYPATTCAKTGIFDRKDGRNPLADANLVCAFLPEPPP